MLNSSNLPGAVVVRWLIIGATALGGTFAYAGDAPPPALRHTDKYLHNLSLTEGYVSLAESELSARRAAAPQATEASYRALRGALQGLATYRAYVGDVQGAIDAFERVWRGDEKFYGRKVVGNAHADLARIDKSHAVDAVEAIARAAQSRQIVILNEAHHVPFDRVFAMHLARALRREGFDYLACETLSTGDDQGLQKGYVARSSGTYSREPTFAKFLMDAQADGWKFVSYEPDVPDALRESGMARNLMARIFKQHPTARVFIYVGYTHAKKVPVSHRDDDDSRLAAQLLRLTGIDPLTINQTTLFDQYNSAQQALYYKHALRKMKTRQPTVLVDARGVPIKLGIDDFAYDVEVVHPAYVDDPSTRRPEWLDADFEPHDVPGSMLPTKARRAIYAYVRGTDPDAVPLDVVVLKPGVPPPKLMLPPGNYVYEYEDLPAPADATTGQDQPSQLGK